MNDDTQSRATYAAGTAELEHAIVVSSGDGVQIAPLPRGTHLILGRQAPATLLVNDPGLSRNHARFESVNGEVWVEDLRSTNGTYINGTRIARAQLLPHDEVTIGAITISVRVTPRLPPVAAEGMESHDVFEMLLKHEVARALGFSRRVSVLMLRCDAVDVGRFVATAAKLPQHLQPADRVALYAPDTAEVLLPELDRAAAATVAATILEQCMVVGMPLEHGIACYPDDASSADELIEVSRLPLRKVGRGPGLQSFSPAALVELRRLAETPGPALIGGEIGTGKEVAARAIHELSALRRGPFLTLRCCVIPEAQAENVFAAHLGHAQGGTLLLDEIADLSLASQIALLRVLDGGARIMATTKKRIDLLAIDGKMRRELVTRFQTSMFRLKPLRDRREEIEPLAAYFLGLANQDNACRVTQIARDAIGALVNYDWPGNVRELRNVIERAVVIAQAGVITRAELPERFLMRGRSDGRLIAPPVMTPESTAPLMIQSVTDETDLRTMLQRFEVSVIEDALARSNGNQSLAAERLGMPRRTLVHKLKSYEIVRRPAGSAPPRTNTVMTGDDGRPLDFRTQLERYEEAIIRRVLDGCQGNVALAARKLGVTEQTLQKKVRRPGASQSQPDQSS